MTKILSILSNDEAEICRENAVVLLQAFLHHCICMNHDSKPDTATDNDPNDENNNNSIYFFLQGSWANFCQVFHERFSPSSGRHLYGNESIVGGTCAEPAEEIRFLLVETASQWLSALSTIIKTLPNYPSQQGLSSSIFLDEHEQNILDSTSQLVHSLYRSVLLDPYPDLNREGCYLVTKLCEVFPKVIKIHLEALLRPLCGVEYDSDISKPKQIPLVRHKHAKIRSLALETSANIVEGPCCISNFPDEIMVEESADFKFDSDNDDNMGFPYQKSESHLENIISKFILPGWDPCTFDKSSSVRMTLMNVVGKALTLLFNFPFSKSTNSTTESRLLIFLLEGMSSESLDISKIALENLKQISILHCKLTNTSSVIVTTSSASSDSCLMKMVQFYFTSMVPILIQYILDWSLGRKLQGLLTMKIIFEIMQPAHIEKTTSKVKMNFTISRPDLEKIISTLCFSFSDDEISVKRAAASCAKMLGKHVLISRCIYQLILPRIRGKDDITTAIIEPSTVSSSKKSFLVLSTPEQYSCILSLLGNLLEGTSLVSSSMGYDDDEKIMLEEELVNEMSSTFACRSILDLSNDREAMWALLHCCKAFLKCVVTLATLSTANISATTISDTNTKNNSLSIATNQSQTRMEKTSSSATMDILLCSLHMLGCPDEFALKEDVLFMLMQLSKKDERTTNNTPKQLFHNYFRSLIRSLFGNDDETSEHESISKNGDTCDRKKRLFDAFEALLEQSDGMTVGENFDLVALIFEKYLVSSFSEKNESISIVNYEDRLQMMAFFESVISNPIFPSELLHPFATRLLDKTIIPNLVWKAGGMASALRKLSAAVLFSMLRKECISPFSLFETATQLLPIIKSNLDDDDAATRQLTCLSTAIIFKNLPCPLGEDTVLKFYPSLLKCLDDSCENIRFASCGALSAFFKAAPSHHFNSGVYENMVEQLLIHMDDPDSRVQDAIYDVLRDSMEIDKQVLIKLVEAAKLCHRSSERCDCLLQQANRDFVEK